MKKYLKQFTGSVTGSIHKFKSNPFELARVRLTVFYTLITMTIISLFSVTLFISLERNNRDLIRRPGPKMQEEQRQVFRDHTDNIEDTILFIDLILLFIVSGFGYVIAGRTLKPIKENMETQRRFLADASHDLRTPLAIMKSESQVLIQSNSQNIGDYKSVIISNIEEIGKMTNLVEDLLLIARSESDTVNSVSIIEDVDMQKLVEKLVLKMKIEANKKSIDLNLDSSVTKLIKGNPQNLERAVRNILQNAINYTPEGGKVSINLSQNEGFLSMKISDTGVGINEFDLPKIFDRFYKAEHSRNDASGSGLGLPIAKQIIEQHGGNISISSNNKGTEVLITLPKT